MRLGAILAKLANLHVDVTFRRDRGGNSLTIFFKAKHPYFLYSNENGDTQVSNMTHTHIGVPDDTSDEALDTFLYQALENALDEVEEMDALRIRTKDDP